MAASLLDIIKGSGYELPETFAVAKQTITKGEAVSRLNHCYIQQIDHEANIIEQWDLINAWVKEVNFGDLDYESDDINEITVKMRYDFAKMSIP
mgnify:FL=1